MPKFLIVDDDPACRRLLKLFLSPYGRCDLVQDGHEAIAAARIALESDSPYDLICLDIMMPGDDGHQVLEAIRRLELEHHVCGNDGAKVIMTTALVQSKHCAQAFREGCESYLTKPILEQRLLEEVQELLGERRLRTGGKEAELEPESRHARPGRSRYLIVDDDRVCRELLKDFLSPYGDCDFAYDGAEAIDAVRLAIEDGAPYDLVCLDIMMPRMSGHDALQGIRQTEEAYGIFGSEGVKVIMTTALRDSKHCIRAFREGCESYITKPIHEADILAKMRELGVPPSTKRDDAPRCQGSR